MAKKAAAKRAPKGSAKKPAAAPKSASAVEVETARKVLAPCTFCKPGFNKSEEGDELVTMKLKIPDNTNGGVGMRAETARELFGKTHVRIDFSRRSMGEWGQGELPGVKGAARIISCETDVPSFSWSAGNWQCSFTISAEVFSLEDAIDVWKKQGTIRVQVIGSAGEGVGEAEDDDDDETDDEENEEPGVLQLPGTSSQETGDTHNVSLTDQYRMDIQVRNVKGGKYACLWGGVGPTGSITQQEDSIRSTLKEAVIASLGNAIDFWLTYTGDEEKEVIEDLRWWQAEVEAGKSLDQIESELEKEDEEDQTGDK